MEDWERGGQCKASLLKRGLSGAVERETKETKSHSKEEDFGGERNARLQSFILHLNVNTVGGMCVGVGWGVE